LGNHDDKRIVIDEVLSILITFSGHALSPGSIVVGFLANRLFDIWKPAPLRAAEKIGGGWGVVLDDVLAGTFANLVLVALTIFGLL
jgi:phosphatidylglycerophosphatase A